MKKYIFIAMLSASLLGNCYFGFIFLIQHANAPHGKVGVLKEDIPVGMFMDNQQLLFTLPKGLAVKDSSPQFIASAGLFEPYRFIVEISSDRELVDFEGNVERFPFGELYSADGFYDYETKSYQIHQNP